MITYKQLTQKTIYLNRDSSWLNAIIHNDTQLWNEWLSQTNNIDITDETGQTPLHWACFLQKRDFVIDLLSKGANPWHLDDDGLFPWMLAIQTPCSSSWDWHIWPYYFDNFDIHFENNIELQKQVIRLIIKFNQKKKFKELEYITQHIPFNFCQQLFSMKEKGYTFDSLVHLSYSLDSPELLDIVLSWGCDINIRNNEKNTALDFALINDNKKWISLLIKKGAEVYSDKINYMQFVSSDVAGILTKQQIKKEKLFSLEDIFFQAETEKSFQKMLNRK